ncbi:L-lysine 2,3-aminomutase [Commensalibacter sp. Nvir]|uniref:lysine-2,3-aminomutase-like protein n=1 Tax=Commensalibacter sp. Nvir TaxID=3069817 RepID=UPI002D67E4F0|nr:L-lysine 2,3-aminomutase [Commensalibacter sp. Nvir]
MTKKTLRTIQDLIKADLIDSQDIKKMSQLKKKYAIAIPSEVAELIHSREDPIGLQYIPHISELVTHTREISDPIGDESLSPIRGIVHRYPDRALLKPILMCPVYCRFCFRREHVGLKDGVLNDHDLSQAIEWIKTHENIEEIILSGGDPLLLSPRRLKFIIAELSRIDHIKIIRIHTRMPFSTPSKITASLIDALSTDKALWVVVHANHPLEFTEKAFHAVQHFTKAGIPMLSQSVLLKNVNDDATVLETLFKKFLTWKIKPYYLHQLDHAPGTYRFYVPIEQGQKILRTLRGRITGLAWPTYVLDIPGGYGKVPIGPIYYHNDEPDTVLDPSQRKRCT